MAIEKLYKWKNSKYHKPLITGIVSRSGFRGAGSILSEIEYPTVATNIIDGIANSFNLILIG